MRGCYFAVLCTWGNLYDGLSPALPGCCDLDFIFIKNWKYCYLLSRINQALKESQDNGVSLLCRLPGDWLQYYGNLVHGNSLGWRKLLVILYYFFPSKWCFPLSISEFNSLFQEYFLFSHFIICSSCICYVSFLAHRHRVLLLLCYHGGVILHCVIFLNNNVIENSPNQFVINHSVNGFII